MSIHSTSNKGAVMSTMDQLKGRSFLRVLQEMEERYDPDGNISGFCRPILKEQRDKLVQILADNREGDGKTPHESSIDAQAAVMGDPGF